MVVKDLNVVNEEKKPLTVDTKLDILTDMVTRLVNVVEVMQRPAPAATFGGRRATFGGRRLPTPMKDLKTGVVYFSKAEVGKKFADEAGASAGDNFAFYKVIGQLLMDDGSTRFVDASPEEAAKSIKDRQESLEREIAEANRLAAIKEKKEARVKAKEARDWAKPMKEPKKRIHVDLRRKVKSSYLMHVRVKIVD